KEAEADEDGGARVDVDRLTASATYHQSFGNRSIWASTIGWGRNAESGHEATYALLAESRVTLRDRDSLYGRYELSPKACHDLVLPGDEVFTVAKAQAGYTRYLANMGGIKAGIGVSG